MILDVGPKSASYNVDAEVSDSISLAQTSNGDKGRLLNVDALLL